MSHSLELIKRVLDIKKRKLIWNYSSGNLKIMGRKFSKLLLLLQMGLNDTKHLAENLKKKLASH